MYFLSCVRSRNSVFQIRRHVHSPSYPIFLACCCFVRHGIFALSSHAVVVFHCPSFPRYYVRRDILVGFGFAWNDSHAIAVALSGVLNHARRPPLCRVAVILSSLFLRRRHISRRASSRFLCWPQFSTPFLNDVCFSYTVSMLLISYYIVCLPLYRPFWMYPSGYIDGVILRCFWLPSPGIHGN